MSKYPCENCICVPMCRHKDYGELIRTCSLVRDMLYHGDYVNSLNRRPGFYENIGEMERVLTPVGWELKCGKNATYYILSYKTNS